MRSALLLSTILLAFFSCTKTEKTDLGSFLECHQSQQADSATISNKLAGTWSQSLRFCYKDTNFVPIAYALKVTFNPNGSFNVSEKSGILTHGTWKLKNLGINMWGLDLTSQSEYLYGRILFCKNEVLFDNTYVNGEGCLNKFYK